MIKNNKLIKGIIIDNVEYKLTQFADDTTLILDGSRDTLLEALNILEIYGTLSGLKMNKDKTKVIWIGRKKYSKEKIECKASLKWGDTEFILLGLNYNVDLKKMVNQNFEKSLVKGKVILCNWNKRYMTPIGKITVIKTFFLPLFNHLFISLPNPNQQFISELKGIMFKFIWDNKPDKVSRATIVLDYNLGGLKMTNIEIFIKCLKCTWIKKMITNCDTAWLSLLKSSIPCIIKGINFYGTQWCANLNNRVTNPFWQDVFDSWNFVYLTLPIKTTYDLHSSPIWFNPKIKPNLPFHHEWCKKGLRFIKDLLNEDNSLKSFAALVAEFSLEHVNFLHYYQIKTIITRFISENSHKTNSTNINFGPILPHHLKHFIGNNKSSQSLYNAINNTSNQGQFARKWEEKLSTNINYFAWKIIFKSCFKVVCNPEIVWFQYKIIQNILGVNNLLNKVGISVSNQCRLCQNATETIIHLFYDCEISKQFWNEIKVYIFQKTRIQVTLDLHTIILGYLNSDTNFEPINTIVLTVKRYIFGCASKQKAPNLACAINKLKVCYCEKRYWADLNDQQNTFEKIWTRWGPVFLN